MTPTRYGMGGANAGHNPGLPSSSDSAMPSTYAPVPAPAVLADQAHPQDPQNLEILEVPEVSANTATPPPLEVTAQAALASEAGSVIESVGESVAEGATESASAAAVSPVVVDATAATDAPADHEASDLDPAAQALEPVAAAPAPAKADVNPAACAQQLKQLFPALFAGTPKPLKLRIQVDIQERSPGLFTKPMLTAFFRRYTGSTAYLIAVSRAKQRFDLDGQPSGELTEEHREVALAELARRRANTESRVALEEQQRRNRATLLHDFGQTTLTPANFCALKGIAEGELDGYLATARREAEERAQQPAFEPRRPAGRQQPNQRRR